MHPQPSSVARIRIFDVKRNLLEWSMYPVLCRTVERSFLNSAPGALWSFSLFLKVSRQCMHQHALELFVEINEASVSSNADKFEHYEKESEKNTPEHSTKSRTRISLLFFFF